MSTYYVLDTMLSILNILCYSVTSSGIYNQGNLALEMKHLGPLLIFLSVCIYTYMHISYHCHASVIKIWVFAELHLQRGG